MIRSLTFEECRLQLQALAHVLVQCVEGGASVSFLSPFPQSAAEQFFAGAIAEVSAGHRILLAAFEDELLIGTVQLILALPPNQPHRGEIAKLLVSPASRGKGVAAALMQSAEAHALSAGKTLLVLDTVTGGKAEELYLRLGWTKAGIIPNYALFPDGRFCDTSIFWKALA